MARTRKPLIAPMTERELGWQKEVLDLVATIDTLREQLKWREDARDGYYEGNKVLKVENERLRKELDATERARMDVARLEGVLQGLERAGKIDPSPVEVSGFTGYRG